MRSTVEKIFRITSLLLLILAFSMVFVPAIAIDDTKAAKEFRKECKEAAKDAIDELEDDDVLELLEEECDRTGININVKKLPEEVKPVLKYADSMSFSYFDTALLGIKIRPLINYLSDKKLITGIKKVMHVNSLKTEISAIETATPFIYVYLALLATMLIVYVVVIILHLCKVKLPGYTVLIISILFGIMPIIAVPKINDIIWDYMDVRPFKCGISPYILMGAAALSFIFWIIRNILSKPADPTKTTKKIKAPTSVGFCGKCGFELFSDMDFCPFCGNKR